MAGFKEFLMRGNLVELAVAFVVGAVFAVVTRRSPMFMDVLGKLGGNPDFSSVTVGGVTVGAFLTALIAFVIVAAVVYFGVVLPYNKAKARFDKPAADEAAAPTSEELLDEIRDSSRPRASNRRPLPGVSPRGAAAPRRPGAARRRQHGAPGRRAHLQRDQAHSSRAPATAAWSWAEPQPRRASVRDGNGHGVGCDRVRAWAPSRSGVPAQRGQLGDHAGGSGAPGSVSARLLPISAQAIAACQRGTHRRRCRHR